MNTQTTKKSFKLNFFDILLIVLAVLVIGAAALIFLAPEEGSGANQTPIEFTVLVRDVPAQMKIRTKAGDQVTNSIYLSKIGQITAVKRELAYYDAFDYTNDKAVHAQYSDIYNVAFTIRADAHKTDTEYVVGSTRVGVGAEVHFRTPNFVGYGYVTDVTEISASADETK